MFAHLKHKGFSSVAMHLLGNVHGKISERLAVQFFLDGLKKEACHKLEKVWLIGPKTNLEAIRKEFVEQL